MHGAAGIHAATKTPNSLCTTSPMCWLSCPTSTRQLAEQLKTKNVSEIANEKGVPRTTMYKHIHQLRMHFEDTGLKDYL